MTLSDPYNNYWQKRKPHGFRYRYNVFKKWIAPGSHVLDVGSGDGALADFLQNQNGCEVTCIDVSEVAIERVRSLGLKGSVVDIEKSLPFPDKSFDYVVASEVIEHIPRSEDLLREMARISKKYVIISIPNTGFWKYRLGLLVGHFPKQWVMFPYEHVRFWTLSDFKKMISDLGFKLEAYEAAAGRRFIRDIYPDLFASQMCYKIRVK